MSHVALRSTRSFRPYNRTLLSQEGSRAHLDPIWKQHGAWEMMYTNQLTLLFKGMGLGQAQAEDLTQETWLEVWQSFESFRGESSFRSWVWAIARRIAWRYFKKKRSDSQLVYSDELEHKSSDALYALALENQEASYFTHERNIRIRSSIHLLPLLYRQVIALYYLEGYTHKKISQTLHIAVGTSKSRLHKALQLLRNKVQLYT